ncbi:MAG: thioredoxin [Clostridia bacterium]|nr:thioredoxin [Clostridia bacterium]
MEILNKNTFYQKIGSDRLVLVDFFATWCMPCRMLAPILEGVAEANKDIDVCKLDIDESSELAREYRVFSVPTLILFKNGKAVDHLVGLNSVDAINDFIAKNR